MKTHSISRWSFGFALAVLPFIGGCGLESAHSEPTNALTVNETSDVLETNAPDPEAAEQNLENAWAKVISAPQPAATTNVSLSAPAAELVKLAQAGVDESVMLAYVTNSPYVFNLSSDDIIYLNDIGVPGAVVTAMIQRDQTVKTNTSLAAAPPVYTNQLVPPPGAPTPYATQNAPTETVDTESTPAPAVEYGDAQQPANASYTYFYNSLAPYGTWVDVAGYGPCWQPMAVAVNRDWQPYCNRGRWVYSDCGWYWASDYSWGWAPFHYGRWFHHNRWGWCWAPDTVWGPSWVTWRYSSGYCGWAPLPPTACYTPGFGFSYFGRSVGATFSFGLNASHFSFVPVNHFYDRIPSYHRVPTRDVNRIYNNTVVVNHIVQGNNNTIINRGIPVTHISSATHTDIKPVSIRTTDDPAQVRLGRGARERTLPVFRPDLPQPQHKTTLVGEGVKPASPGMFRPGAIRPDGANRAVTVNRPDGNDHIQAPSVTAVGGNTPPETVNRNRDQRRNDPVPTANNEASTTHNDVRTENRGNNPSDGSRRNVPRQVQPLIMRGANRTTSPTVPNSAVPNSFNSAPASPPANAVVQPQNDSAPATSGRRQFTAPSWQVTPPVRVEPQTFPRQEVPKHQQQSEREWVQPAAPVQRQQSIPTYNWPKAAEPREQQPWVEVPRSQAPVQQFNSPARSEVAPPTPRSENRQAPPPQSAPSRNESRQDRQDKQNGRNR
jgi:hypothetical protein